MGIVIIVCAVAGIAAGRIPWLRMNRATIALAGAAFLIAAGTLTPEQAFGSLDMDTLVLVFSMMIINVNLKLSGFFRLVGSRVLTVARSPSQLLALIVLSSGILSALFLNDTIVLMFTPLVATVVVSLGRNPIPYLMGLATSANIGSMATIIGNPQNMLIGASSGMGFLTFTSRLVLPSLAGLAVSWLVIVLIYRKEFGKGTIFTPPEEAERIYPPLLMKSLGAVVLMLVPTLLGVRVSISALIAASMLLVTRRIKPSRVFREIDWSLLVLFSGLFIITEAIRSIPELNTILAALVPTADRNPVLFAGIAAVFSNLISNVPAVMVMRPIIPHLADPDTGWLLLAASTTLAGNLTLIGSIANLIVAESASRFGIHLSFRKYLTAGIPITLLSLAVGIALLTLVPAG